MVSVVLCNKAMHYTDTQITLSKTLEMLNKCETGEYDHTILSHGTRMTIKEHITK